MTDKLEIAFVGCGGVAEARLRGVQTVAHRISVTAVVETDQARRADMARRTGARPFASLQEALACGQFDAVDIMLPHDLHEEAALACFAAGKHVLLEKPIAHTLASAERILAAAATLKNQVFMIAEQSQYWGDVIKARELIDAGAIGKMLNARACYQERNPGPGPDAPPPWRYLLDRAGGGITIDGVVHWIRPLRMLLGEVDEVVAVTGRHMPRMQGESWSQSILRFASGVTAFFDAKVSAAPFGPAELFRVTGDEGELVITRGRNAELKLFNASSPDGETILDDRPAGGNPHPGAGLSACRQRFATRSGATFFSAPVLGAFSALAAPAQSNFRS
jgi:UDP-N-acetyl-2-amino-2-deoxyglucuronate dehydrogenase